MEQREIRFERLSRDDNVIVLDRARIGRLALKVDCRHGDTNGGCQNVRQNWKHSNPQPVLCGQGRAWRRKLFTLVEVKSQTIISIAIEALVADLPQFLPNAVEQSKNKDDQECNREGHKYGIRYLQFLNSVP